MSISQTLSNATSGLSAASRLVGVASNNIANALTPGYSRREATLAERVSGGNGAGVVVAGVRNAEAQAITRELRAATANATRDGAIADAARAIAEIFGSAESPASLFAKFATFDSRLRALADAPDNAAAQTQLLAAIKSLATGVNAAGDKLQQLRSDADSEIAKRVDDVNLALADVERLNIAIEKANVSGADANALIDQRKAAISRINESIPVRELTRENGKIDLMTPEGVLLLAGTARTIAFTPRTLVTAADAYAGGRGTLSGISVDGVDITPGGAGRALDAGALAGLFDVRDRTLPEAAAQLDAFTQNLIERFSTPGADPTLAAGAPGLFTDSGAALAPPPAPGLASRLSVNPLVDPGAGGALFRLRDGLGAVAPGPSGSDVVLRSLIASVDRLQASPEELGGGRALSLAELAAELPSTASSRLQSAENARQASQTYEESLSAAELSATGVDADAELQKLIVIQQAYAANARVIETANQMIQRLLEI